MNGLLLIAVPVFPLAAALVIAASGPRLARIGGRIGGWISTAATAASLISLYFLSGNVPVKLDARWGVGGAYELTVGLLLDSLSFYTAIFVAAVAFFVNLHAVGYMGKDPGRSRFFAQMAFFTGAMLMLVLAGSFIVLFAAWEWVGLASFLLIGFWYDRKETPGAARNAFLITRTGDAGFLLGWLLALFLAHTTDMGGFLEKVGDGSAAPGMLTLVALLLLAGAAGKSAQLPLSAWLPPAMAGPTPVSALIHSATMAAAGVYLILRLYPLFQAAPHVLTVILWMGAATALFAALTATVQNDLKRILAWSTISQLGEMFFALGLAGPLAALFHLTTHGFFKATLFLAAGSVEHGAKTRDISRTGRLWRKMPATATIFALSGLALSGIWPFSGFFSEDRILAMAASRGTFYPVFLVLLIAISGIYISRAAMAVFGPWPGAPAPRASEPGRVVLFAMSGLAIFAAGAGWALSGRIGHLVAFVQGPELALYWKIAAVLAGLAGIGYGAGHVFRYGPRPALGEIFSLLERNLNRGTQGFGRMAILGASGLTACERGLDRAAGAVKKLSLDTAAVVTVLEENLDRGARAATGWTLKTALGVDRIELAGFALGMNRFAGLLGRSGGRLVQLQSGKLYLYTLGLFIWALLVALGGFLVWFAL